MSLSNLTLFIHREIEERLYEHYSQAAIYRIRLITHIRLVIMSWTYSVLLDTNYLICFKNLKNAYFDQRFGCATPKHWLKYTTNECIADIM